MITTVTLNPALDKILEIENLKLGHVHRVKKVRINLGGKSINVSRILTGLSIDNKGICFVGSENFSTIKSFAKENKLQLNFHVVSGMTRTNVKLIDTQADNQTTDINEPGFSVTKSDVATIEDSIKEIARTSDYLVLSGSMPKGMSTDFYGNIASQLKNITKVIIDADGESLMAGIQGSPYMIKPNIHELESALQIKFRNSDDIINTCKKTIAQYNITYILVSMGTEGSLLVGTDIVLHADAVPINVQNTVGAGDAMVAGFIYGLSKNNNLNELDLLKKAMANSVASSAIAISSTNTTFTKEALESISNKVKIYIGSE